MLLVVFSTKKSAQDAHEAIRPTSLEFSPEKIEKYLTPDQSKLYSLIWKRFVASQMNPAVYDTISCDIEASQNNHAESHRLCHQVPRILSCL
jgi:DNA topoisomerase-1